MGTWLRVLLLLGAVPLALSSCASRDDVSSRASAIVNGDASGPDDDAVVLIMTHDASQDSSAGLYYEICTGTLLAPDIVLTARHCVSHTSAGTYTCDQTGKLTSGTGGRIGADFPLSDSHVFVGDTLPANLDPTTFPGRAAAFVHDDGAVLCNDDVALIVLTKPVAGAKIAPIRLDGPVTTGETLGVVGWGATTSTVLPQQRQRRDGVSVVDVGPSPTVRLGGELADEEFIASESACFGDSGGPAFDEATGAVVGTVARGDNGGITSDGSGCVNTQHVFMQTAGFQTLVMQAFAQTGEQPWLEGRSGPGAGPGDAGTDAGSDGADAGASDGSNGGGCTMGHGGSPSWWLIALLGAAVATRRRRGRREPGAHTVRRRDMLR